MGTEGAGELELLVAAGERSFGRAVADGLEAARAGVTATLLDPSDDPVDQATANGADGIVVGSGIETPVAVVRQGTEPEQPVVLLAEADSGGTVDDALEAGVADVFPRTAVERQCARIVDRIATLGEGDPGVTEGADTTEKAAVDPSAAGTVTDEEPYREVFENVSDGLVVHEPDTGEIVDVNERFCEMNGYDRSELVGEDITLVTAPGEAYDEAAAQAKIEQARREGMQLFEWRNQRHDGETYPVEVHLAVVELDGYERVLASVRDITERKQRERELEEQRRLYETLVEQGPNGVMIVQDREIAFVNPGMVSLTGDDEADLLGQRFSELMTPEYRDLVEERYDQRAHGDGEDPPENYEIRIETAAGETRTIDLYVSRIRYRGAPATLATFNDITELRRREREARESERRLRLIAEHIDEVIYLSTADFSEILYINPAYEDIYGQPIEELSENPQSFVEAAHPDDRERYEADVAELVADIEAGDTRAVYEGEYRLAVDDEARWIRVARSPVANDEGVVDRIVGRVQDITERRRREREYEQIFNGVTDAIAIQDPGTAELLDANRTFVERLGYDDMETVLEKGNAGLSATDAGYTAERARELCQRVMETGEPETVEWAQETKGGDRLLIEATVTPAVIGGEDRIVSIQRDITEHRQLERRFRTIAERVDEIIYLANTDLTEVTYVNSAYADIYGRPAEELHEDPRAFIEAMHPEDREPYEAELEAMLADIEAGDPDDRYEFDFRIQRPDGEVRWLEAAGYPILDETDRPDQFVGVVTDVTERHEREQTLETFHEATRQLTAADSQVAACRRAVEAAEEVLGFPLVSVYRYDEERGALEPTALTTRLSELDVDPPSFGPGDSVPWQVFVEGEAVTQSEPTTSVYGPGVSDPDIVLPMGSHGVMLVGAPDEQFDAEHVELAQILAATLEAALNHVAGERELAEREAELRRQQERADRLERLNTIIRDIEQATVEQSSRAGIEEAVCERLVDVADHDFVWVAEPTVGDDGLVPRTSAGGPEGYVDGLTGVVGSTAEAGAGGHPAVAAYRADEARAVENVATDIATGAWRKHALGHGIQSVVAVPIRYETTTHGVLSVASTAPDAFDEATREVLADLGRSIGYAITVTEREQALESDGTTELELAVADEGLFMIRGATTADCRIDLERTIRRTGGSFSMFYAVEGADPATVVELADAAPSVATAQVVSADEAGTGGLVEVTAPTWFGSVFTEHGAVVREATAEPGDGTLVVEAPRGTDVRALVEGFQERYPDAELVAQRQRERTIRSLFELQDALETELTDRQWEALETAYSAGYFGWPRETSGQEVAELLGVSQPTFNKHLRIAEQSAFRMLLEREYPDADG
ncbi:PAS domain S-box protein [Haloglomus litoreum]|uniref:PAS domain S-box protein n=1 Tax=Haloglomus litoreum TaxID=3034026 RepID=UPI0023E7CDA8|nr:PAS domain S-box protein [Haloglomus sp. DT116]